MSDNNDQAERSVGDIEVEIGSVESEWLRVKQNNPPGVGDHFKDEFQTRLDRLYAELEQRKAIEQAESESPAA